MPAECPICHIVAGPNGSGKSTFALRYLPRYAGSIEYVNPDLFAQGVSPLDIRLSALEAGKRSLLRIRELILEKTSFGFETTLSGRSYFSLIETCKGEGFSVHLYYLWMPEMQVLPTRIAHRVRLGGHDVPRQDVERRYGRSLENLPAYMDLVDRTYLFDAEPIVPRLILQRNGEDVEMDPERVAQFRKEMPS